MSIKPSGWSVRKRILCLAVIVVTALIVVSWLARRHQQRAFAQRTRCVGNLVHINLAKLGCQESLGLKVGGPIPVEELQEILRKDLGKPLDQYKCPNGGTYLIGNAGVMPKCTYTNICYTYDFEKTKLRLERRAWKHSLEP